MHITIYSLRIICPVRKVILECKTIQKFILAGKTRAFLGFGNTTQHKILKRENVNSAKVGRAGK